MRYLGEKCPFCKTNFTDESDTVVCPECGTPHHRECYNELGNCFNKELHKNGFIYSSQNDSSKEPAKKAVNIDEDKDEIGSETEQKEAKDGKGFPPFGYVQTESITPQTDMDGITGEEYANFLGASAKRYMPRFFFLQRTGKKMMANLFAFLLPFTFAAYKRMYRLAAVLLAVNIFFIGIGIYGSLQKEPVKAIVIMTRQAAADGEITKDETEQIRNAIDELSQIELKANWTDYVTRYKLSVNVLTGLFATYLYMKESERKIKGLKKSYTSKEMHNELLSRLGKGTLMLPILGYITIFIAALIIFGLSI